VTVWHEFHGCLARVFQKKFTVLLIHTTVWHEFNDGLVQSTTIHLSISNQSETDLATSRYRYWFLVADGHKRKWSKRSAMLPSHKSSPHLDFSMTCRSPPSCHFFSCHDLDLQWQHEPLSSDACQSEFTGAPLAHKI
jgi:hypothetical protein